jgi:hypothetical protein
MYNKEEAGYGILAVFVIVSSLFIVLLLPFEPITTYAVLNQTDSNAAQSGFSTFFDFVMQNYLLIIVVFVILALSLAGIIFFLRQNRHSNDILSTISPLQLDGLVTYIKATMAQGYTKEQVKSALKDAGWQDKVSEAVLTKF